MQIARHPVGAAQVNFLVAAVLEVINPAVLQESPYDAAHLDAIAHPAYPGIQRADAAHDQLNLHARLAGAIQLLHHVLVQQRVHLRHDPCRLARPRMVGFAGNQVSHPLRQIHRRYQQRIVIRLLAVGRQIVEDVMHRQRHLLIRRQQAQVGVKRRRRGIVISRAQVRVTPYGAIGFLAYRQAQLAVRLQPHQPVEDLHSGVFQLASPSNVAGLIEARLHLDDDRDFLRRRRLHQRLHNRRVVVRPVQCLLDAQYRWVGRRRLNETDHAVVAVKGMVQQHVALAQSLPDIFRALGQRPLPRLEWLELQVRPIHRAVQEHQPAQVHRPRRAIHLPVLQLKHGLQAAHNLFARTGLQLQTHGIALAAVVQLGAHTLQYRARFLFLQVQVAVARNAERAFAHDLVAAIHASRVQSHQVRQRDE